MTPRWTWAKKPEVWTISFVVLGLALRLGHYLRNPSVWHDEAALILNVIGKSFPELLGPLFFSEAAPPLFLWLEKAAACLLGDSTFALRLLPFLASCVTLLGMVWIARRLVQPWAVVWVALFIACSDRLLWHSCEAKPYAIDALAATALLAGFTWARNWPLNRQLLACALAAPVVVFLTYPGCFLLGGLALSLLPAVLRQRWRSSWVLYGLFGVALCGSFLLMLLGPVHAQRDDRLLDCWRNVFPNWEQPWTVPGWLVQRLTEVLRYAYEPVGNALCVIAVIGGVSLWRGGQRRLVAFAVLPVALAGLAACARQYPLGAFRVMVFAAPGLLLLTAAGMPPALAWLRRFGWYGPAALTGFVLFPMFVEGYRVCVPWERSDAASAAAYVRQHLQPQDLVAGNAWEHDYYFRDLAQGYQPLLAVQAPPTGRLWLLAADGSVEVREQVLHSVDLLGPWRLIDHADFSRLTVYQLEYTVRKRGQDP